MEEKSGIPFSSAQECMSTFLLFSVISAGPRFVEIQKPWQPRQRDVTTSPLLSRFSAKMILMVHACALLSIEKISFLVVVLILGPTYTDYTCLIGPGFEK